MPALDQAFAVMFLNALDGSSAWTDTVTGLKLRLTVNAPTATVAGTELSGSGYTAGGQAISFAAASGTSTGAIKTSTSALSWTNTGTGTWTIVGLELWDESATPVRKAYGLWDGQPYSIGNGSTFDVAAGAISITVP